MSDSLSFDAFAKLQVPGLRHDAELIEAWKDHRAADDLMQAAGERILRVQATMAQHHWVEYAEPMREGLDLLEQAIDENRHPSRYVGLLEVVVAATRVMLGDDPGPEPHGGPLAAQMAIGVKKK